MPQWDWKCERCGAVRTFTMKTLEEADEANIWCTECAAPAVPSMRMWRQFPITSFILSGSGWPGKDIKG